MSRSFEDDIRNPDRKGPNPFADEALDDVIEANPYAAGGAAGDYEPDSFEAIVPSRGWKILVLGAAGLLCVMLSALGFVFPPCFPFAPLGICFGLLAWVGGVKDLRAMQLGAMVSDDRTVTNLGTVAGAVGSVMGILIVATLLYVWLF